MTATNHALTGALIGLVVGNPAVALPAAFLSHFICDAIPHFGQRKDNVWSRAFQIYLLIDAGLCVLIVAVLAFQRPQHWLLASICAFVATSPDFYWVPRFIYGLRHKKPIKRSRLGQFLGSEGIQWFQRPIGALVEVAWAAGAVVLLSTFVK